jgi:hypothetical protein
MTMMQAISRRTFLKRAPVAAVAIGAPAAAVAVEAHSAPNETPDEKIARLTKELIAALGQSQAWSEWTDWLATPDPKAGIVQLIASRKTVTFSGAGYYAVWSSRNREDVCWIDRAPEKDHVNLGRCYRVVHPQQGQYWMFDDHIQNLLLRKTGGAA